ncbi:MAG: AtpZ/AtpI family protein [Desulfatibacillaceae bacterium]|nr:AtpZ/AtpI family protein [Desulfatibacillaceae bacterium]
MDENKKWQEEKRRFAQTVEKKEKRRIKARGEDKSPLFGLGMFGLVGWSVALPTLGAIALGVWIDKTWPSPISWTLTLLFVGVTIGCLNAWYWIQKERPVGEDLDKEE